MSTLTFRMARPGDEGAVLNIIRALARYEHLEDQVIATEGLLREWLFEKEKAEVLLAEAEGKIVGSALFFHSFSTFLGRAGIYLEDLFVYPEYRGRGYGRALLKKLAAVTLERDCGRLEWACLDWNEPSIAFYKSMGAAPMEDWTTYRLSGETLRRAAED
ncbi:MAG: GNAT family N-acetyltransferase [Lawsonibacter sp.]|nr:GNAT family N-acetyltransferase [Lawsonibacter sp.]